MARYKMTLEYDGTPFSGWQRQASPILSVQGCIEEAILKLTGKRVLLFGAGRTDAGVHATRQVAHFDSEIKIQDVNSFIKSVNFFLRPYPICIFEVCEVQEDFHARFSAKSRSYSYLILNRQHISVLLNQKVWHVREQLDIDLMQEGAEILKGFHDFTSFRSTHCQARSALRTISTIKITKAEPDLVNIYINAPSFLHNQVRIIVSGLKNIGCGEWTIENLKKVLDARDRTMSAATAPACGLYLCDVEY